MKCPVCESVDLTMSERKGVEIDYCPKCRGVWLDRGELDKIIEQSGVAEQPGFKEKRYDRHDDDDHKKHYGQQGPHKRKSSWLSEIFD